MADIQLITPFVPYLQPIVNKKGERGVRKFLEETIHMRSSLITRKKVLSRFIYYSIR